MKNKINFFIILIIIIVTSSINTFANENTQVYLRVEGINKTIMEGNVRADTFVRALQKLGKECNIEVIMKNNFGGQELYSIDGIGNNIYGLKDGWKAYIVRNKEIITVEDINNTTVIDNDKLVLYYGDSQTTKKINDIKETYLDNKLALEFLSSVTTWVEKDGLWLPETLNNTLDNVSVHLLTGSKKIITKKLDSNSKVTFDLKSPNICIYYADGYRNENVPTIVKTNTIKKVLGVDNKKNLTKAEVIAILINYFEIEFNDKVKVKPFEDVLDDNLYKEQIYIAASNSILSGNGNNLFNPDNEITMQELAVILYKIYEDKENIVQADNFKLDSASPWAQPFIKGVIEKGIIKNIPNNWTQTITVDTILSIL